MKLFHRSPVNHRCSEFIEFPTLASKEKILKKTYDVREVEMGGGWDGQGDAAGCKLGRQVLSKTEAKSETASMIWVIEFRAKGNNTAAAAS